jgi:thiazole synthase
MRTISACKTFFRIRDFEITNRLFVGTGKYASYELMQQALEASACQVVTVAVRRERLVDQQGRSLLDFLDLDKYVILPNTAGCFTADDAIRVACWGAICWKRTATAAPDG